MILALSNGQSSVTHRDSEMWSRIAVVLPELVTPYAKMVVFWRGAFSHIVIVQRSLHLPCPRRPVRLCADKHEPGYIQRWYAQWLDLLEDVFLGCSLIIAPVHTVLDINPTCHIRNRRRCEWSDSDSLVRPHRAPIGSNSFDSLPFCCQCVGIGR